MKFLRITLLVEQVLYNHFKQYSSMEADMTELKVWIIPCIMFGIFLALMSAILVYTYSDLDASFGGSNKVNESVTSIQAFQEAMDAKLKR